MALARALVTEPRLLLLDEPLAALDVGTRTELRRELRAELAKFDGARVLVTHELLDAVALADRLVVLEQGRVAQEGRVADVVAQPRSRYVADLVGINLLRGIGRDHEVELETGGTVVTADPVVGDVYVAIHPHSVTLHLLDPDGEPRATSGGAGSPAPTCSATACASTSTGEVPLVAEVTAAAVAELGLHEGVGVWTAVKATDLQIYPA